MQETDGSNFVSEKASEKFSPFWSIGSIWNMGKEKFIKNNLDFIDRLNFKITYGNAGNAVGREDVSTRTSINFNPGKTI